MTSTGTPALDELLDGVRVGDNLVVVSDSHAALAAIGRAFLTTAGDNGPVVIADTEGRTPEAVPTGAVLLDRRSGELDADALIDDLAAADERAGCGAAFLVDSLTSVQRRCGARAALELFLTLCPRLYRRGSVAMWLLDAGSHDAVFLDRMRAITQVLVRLEDDGGELEAEVLTAAGRAPTTLGRRQRFRLEDGTLHATGPVGASRERLGALVRTQRVSRGLSQAELARRVHISPSALSQVERGVRGLGAETLIRIWDALGVPFGPGDTLLRGYRVTRRSGHEDVHLTAGVTGRLLFDDVAVGRCWEIVVEPEVGSDRPLFTSKGAESIVLQRGVLDLRVAGHLETLQEGDSLVASRALIESTRNPGPDRAEALWLVAP